MLHPNYCNCRMNLALGAAFEPAIGEWLVAVAMVCGEWARVVNPIYRHTIGYVTVYNTEERNVTFLQNLCANCPFLTKN